MPEKIWTLDGVSIADKANAKALMYTADTAVKTWHLKHTTIYWEWWDPLKCWSRGLRTLQNYCVGSHDSLKATNVISPATFTFLLCKLDWLHSYLYGQKKGSPLYLPNFSLRIKEPSPPLQSSVCWRTDDPVITGMGPLALPVPS